MVTKQQADKLTEWDAREIIRRGELTCELEFERATWAERSLDLLSKEFPELEDLRKEIFKMIVKYESLHWNDSDTISKEQLKESDQAEKLVKRELTFFSMRKELIMSKLKEHGLNQNDLAEILAHSKSYTSELLNSIRPFTMNDLIIIHRLFDIKLDDLIYTEISPETTARINLTLRKVDSKTTKSNLIKSLPQFPAPYPKQNQATDPGKSQRNR